MCLTQEVGIDGKGIRDAEAFHDYQADGVNVGETSLALGANDQCPSALLVLLVGVIDGEPVVT